MGVARDIRGRRDAAALSRARDLHVELRGRRSRRCAASRSQVADGAVTAVLGNNGAGKSTLLRALSGHAALPSAARSRAARSSSPGAASPARDPADIARAGLVQVPEGRRVFGDLTVEENLRAGGLAARDKARARGPAPGRRAVPDPARAPVAARRRCCPAASSRCSRSAAR